MTEPTEPDLIKIRIAPEVFREMFTRTADGYRIRVELGEPDAEGFHEPTLTIDYADLPGSRLTRWVPSGSPER